MADSTVRILFLGNAGSALRSVRSIESSFGSLGRAARIAGTAIAAGVVGGLALATRAAIEFDRSMRNVNSIAKLGEKQFQSLSKSVLAMAKDTAQSPKTLAEGLYDIVSSGFKANDGLKILRASAKAATAGLTDTATATKAVVAVLNAYHLSAGQAGKVSDILFQTVNKGVLTFEELASQIGDVLPVASQLHVPLGDVGGALATITLHGVSAAEAATQLKQTLVSILKPSVDLKKEIHAMGFETGEAALKTLGLEGFMRKLTVASKGSAAAFADWFPNVRAMNGALGITGKNIVTLHDNIEAMRKSQGAASAAFAEQSKSIAVQWQKAKAALTAAAIPVGQLLFPALKGAAQQAEQFAFAIQAHMPEIKRQFGEVASAVHAIGAEMAKLAISPLGSSAIFGGIAAVGTGKAILGVKNQVGAIGKALQALGPAGIAASAAVGLVAGAFVLIARQGSFAQKEIDGVSRALHGLVSASNAAGQAGRNLEQAKINVATTNAQLTAAEHLYEQAVRRSGRGSLEARNALLNLRQARLNHKQAIADEKTALEQNHQAQAASTRATREAVSSVERLRSKFQDLDRAYGDVAAGAARMGTAGKRGNDALQSQKVREYAAAMSNVARQAAAAAAKIPNTASAAQRAAAQLHAAASAAAALAASLGRIPSKKEVDIFVRTFQVGRNPNTIGGRTIGRAGGGFVPMVAGASASHDSVPAMLTPGEVVLNRAQQNVLGGPRFIASLFGFRGEAGPGFAAGGLVARRPKKKTKPVTKKAPHRPRHPRVKSSGKLASKTLAAVDNVNQREDDLDRAYGQLSRQYGITPDAYGNSLDVTEIDSLIVERQKMLALIDEEKRDLEAAIAALKKAISELLRAIRQEKEAIAQDLKKLRSEKRKKKPNKRVIAGLEHDIETRRTLIENYNSQLGDLRGGLKDSNQNLGHVLPFDRRDVELDIMDLQQQRVDVLKAIADAQASDSGSSDSGGGADSGGGGGAATGGSDQSELIQALLAQIGQLKLALGIQNVQMPIIGSFDKGTLSVSQTGLALVHAGEQITPAGRPKGDGGSISDIKVSVQLEGDLQGLEQFVKVKAVEATPQIAGRMGKLADSRRRSGRF
jgi:TP901 family phage tail tape measure protein